MSFASDLERFAAKVQAKGDLLHQRCVDHAFQSIVDGSPVTGAPGQPVGQYGPGYHPGRVGGFLRASWQRIPETARRTSIVTNAPYAESIEDGYSYRWGVRLTLRSTVGGFHSVKLTRAGWQRIVDQAVAEVGETAATPTGIAVKA